MDLLRKHSRKFDADLAFHLYSRYVMGETELFDDLIMSIIPLIYQLMHKRLHSSYCEDDVFSSVLEHAINILKPFYARWETRDQFIYNLYRILWSWGLKEMKKHKPQEFDDIIMHQALLYGKLPSYSKIDNVLVLDKLIRLTYNNAVDRIRFEDPEWTVCLTFLDALRDMRFICGSAYQLQYGLTDYELQFLRDYAQIIWRQSMYEIRDAEDIFTFEYSWFDLISMWEHPFDDFVDDEALA